MQLFLWWFWSGGFTDLATHIGVRTVHRLPAAVKVNYAQYLLLSLRASAHSKNTKHQECGCDLWSQSGCDWWGTRVALTVFLVGMFACTHTLLQRVVRVGWNSVTFQFSNTQFMSAVYPGGDALASLKTGKGFGSLAQLCRRRRWHLCFCLQCAIARYLTSASSVQELRHYATVSRYLRTKADQGRVAAPDKCICTKRGTVLHVDTLTRSLETRTLLDTRWKSVIHFPRSCDHCPGFLQVSLFGLSF